jgi:ATP diphosphatase
MTQTQEPSSLGRIVELVRDLRNRCPWDAAQTPETLRPYLVEEVLELDHAIGSGDRARIRDELGDVLLHVAFQVVLAEEQGRFGAEDLTRQVEEKMWRRHPHLFQRGAEGAEGAGPDDGTRGRRADADNGERMPDDGHRWEAAKILENPSRPSVLDGLPPTLPSLIMAYRLQERAAGVGFDWPDAKGPLAKVHEETAELEDSLEAHAQDDAVRLEIGDLLFAVVNLARKLGHDPRAALEETNAKFERRFRAIERMATEREIDVGSASLEQLDALWDEVKAAEK